MGLVFEPYLSVRVAGVFPGFELDGEAKVSHAGGQIAFQQHVLRLEIAMRYRGLIHVSAPYGEIKQH